jgi:dihydrodipicolinate synthase/N-acetylneuraminate lyase
MALEAGADGAVSGIAAAIPELPVAMWQAARAGNLERLGELDRQLQSFMEWLAKLPPTVAIKQAIAFRTWFAPSYAVPLTEAGTETAQEFRSWLVQWMPPMLVQSRPAAYKH